MLNDQFFNLFVRVSGIDSVGEKNIKYIDGAEIIDKRLGTIRTKFGVTCCSNLSTGAKTTLNIIHIAKNDLDFAVNVSGCGWNSLNCIFEFLDLNNSCVPILLQHLDFRECNNFELMANESYYCKNIRALKSYAFEMLEENNAKQLHDERKRDFFD
jgi:hypothetical protein